MQRGQLTRLVAAGALGLAILALVVLLLSSGSTYVVHARFSDAGQLVRGDLVTVAGHQVGTVGALTLAPNGQADVELDISDDSVTPLRAGSLAHIGQISLTGVANRFVGLTPGSAGAPIPNGGVLPASQTRGIVDLDTLLDSLTPPVRSSLKRLLKTGAYTVSGSTPRSFNEAARFSNPALTQVAQLGRELVSDRFALERLLSSTAEVSGTLAARSGDLGGAVTFTAATLRQVASERTALQDTLVRAPGVLSQGRGVLADVNYALGQLNPALRDLQPVAPRLGTLLRIVSPTAHNALPLIRGVQALVAPAKRSLLGLLPVERKATPAIISLTRAIGPLTPVLAGLRPYVPAVVAGFFGGVGGYSGGYYDANGEYLRTQLVLGPSGISGVLSMLGADLGGLDVTGLFNGTRTGVLAPCPGGATTPAYDRSNPWSSPDVLPGTGQVCDPKDNH